MAKWKCEICGNEFDNFHAQGFDNKIYCPLCYFKKLYNDTELEREKLQKQLQQKDNIIKEVREYILTHKLYCFEYDEEELFEITTDKKAKDDLLKILQGADKE